MESLLPVKTEDSRRYTLKALQTGHLLEACQLARPSSVTTHRTMGRRGGRGGPPGGCRALARERGWVSRSAHPPPASDEPFPHLTGVVRLKRRVVAHRTSLCVFSGLRMFW